MNYDDLHLTLAVVILVFAIYVLVAIFEEVRRIRRVVCKAVAVKIQFKLGRQKLMAGQLTDAQEITASVAEVDAAGQPVSIADPSKVSWTIGDPTIASLSVDPATGIATFKGLKPGTTSVGVTDSSNGLSAQDTLTVTSGPATTLQIAFGTPTDQAPAPAVG